MPRLRLDMPAHLADALSADADVLGVPVSALAATDLIRYRAIALAAVPKLDAWQWSLLSHVLSGAEAARILHGDDSLPSAGYVCAEIDTWADGAQDDEVLKAGRLCKQVTAWSPLTIAGVLMRLRQITETP